MMRAVRITTLAIATALAAGASARAQGAFLTGNDLFTACTGTRTAADADCTGYVTGVADALLAVQGFGEGAPSVCLSANVTRGQMRDVVPRYLERNPQDRHYGAASTTFVALRQAFPCPSGQRSTR